MLTNRFVVADYDLAATLMSGQAFRWRRSQAAWEGVIHGRWVQLRQVARYGSRAFAHNEALMSAGDGVNCERKVVETVLPHPCPLPLGEGESFAPSIETPTTVSGMASSIEATTAEPQADWDWLTNYLRLNDDHAAALASFPDDEPMRAATAHCRGLRLLRQEPWECLASFILSSTKQIVQIQQCVDLLCQKYGERIPSATEGNVHFTFPTPARIAAASEAELRLCKMGFRAKYLLDAARRVSTGQLDMGTLPRLPLAEARAALMECHGVGRKIADCVLLFSLGFDEAFPIDVWVERALQRLYFPKRRAKKARLERFAATHFGPQAGLAQQYLFHYLRTGKRS